MAAAGVRKPMSDEKDENITIITMDDMAAVFAVTDACSIHRESVSVELAREDPGMVAVSDRGVVEITLPASRTPADFADTIRRALEERGYSYHPDQVAANGDADDDDDGDDWLA